MKANQVLREEELTQCREQVHFYEEQAAEQAQKYLDLQHMMNSTGVEFDQFKEQHLALQSEL